MVGRPADDAWNAKYPAYDSFDAKGAVEGLLEAISHPSVRFRVAELAIYWLPGRAAEILAGKVTIGWVKTFILCRSRTKDIEVPVIAFEISVASLLRLSQKDLLLWSLQPTQGIPLTWQLSVDERHCRAASSAFEASAGGKLLCDIVTLDVYRDPLRW